MNLHLVESSDKSRILNFLQLIDKEFVPALHTRVNLDEYSVKLATGAVNLFLVSEYCKDVAHAAFYCNEIKSKVAFLSSIGVIPSFQGRGAAELLLQRIINICIDREMDFLRLEVDLKNSKAVGFYKKHDFCFISNSLMEKKLRII